MKKLLMIIACLLAIAGCDSSTPTENAQKETQKPTSQPIAVVMPNGETIELVENTVTPKSTEYEAKGAIYHRTVEVARVASPFGLGAGEVINSQKPAQIETGQIPSVNITPDGVGASEAMKTEFTGGSGSATWLSNLWTKLKDWGLIFGIGLLALFILPIFIPALAPIFSKITGAIGSFFTWLIPFFGGLIEKLAHLKTQTALNQVVAGGDTFKELVNKSNQFTDAQKGIILSLFAQAHDTEQDKSTQEKVNQAQSTNA